ncbi:hypothetical protein V760_02595 [Staphylococcus aureus F23613]|nr:hypothetical protein V760_02595 [Staphylococcus aureus F23613]
MTVYVAILFCIVCSAFFTYYFINSVKYDVKKNISKSIVHGIYALIVVLVTCLCIYGVVYIPSHPYLESNL